MSWQTLFIQNPCRLSIKNANILLKRQDEDNIRFAITEISAIVIESRNITLTSSFLAKCAENNIVILSCNDKYMPVGIYYPFSGHSRFTKHAFQQSLWNETFKNRAWQKIIKTKINNQNSLIKKITKKSNITLKELITKVSSGDKSNIESRASRIYWKALFDNFYRGNLEDIRNSALNYGYAIVRSAIARSLAASGFIPAFGLHHKSELNAFNLADDIIEVFRPFVDNEVYKLFDKKELRKDNKLAKEDKVTLINILNIKITIEKEKTSLLSAINKITYSLLKATENKDSSLITLPKL